MKSIFVSSTFKDMQWERDMLQSVVVPRLRAFAAQFGESIRCIDLRWGIDTTDLDTEEGCRKILTVCMDAIDKCRPYMIVFLGERYGWVPEPGLIRDAARRKKYAPGPLEKSVTELEIEYGAFYGEGKLSRCLFYFRKPLSCREMTPEQRAMYQAEDRRSEKRLNGLKHRIRRHPRAKVYEYQAGWDAAKGRVTGLEALAERICQDVTGLLAQEYGHRAALCWQEAELLAARESMAERADSYRARAALLEEVREDVLEPYMRLYVLHGRAGSGKSCLLAKLAARLQAEKIPVFPFLCGSSARSSGAWDLVRQMVYFLETQLGRTQRTQDTDALGRRRSFGEWREALCQLCAEYGRRRMPLLVLAVDALDQLSRDEISETLAWLPDVIPENIRVAATCLSEYPLPEHLFQREGAYLEELDVLDPADRQEAVAGILKANGKELDPEVVQTMLRKHGADNPLYLGLLMQRLMMLDSEDFQAIERGGGGIAGISAFMAGLIRDCPEDLAGLCQAVLAEAGERIDSGLCRRALSLLAVTRHGLRTADLEAIFARAGWRWSTLDFERLLQAMQPFFAERGNGAVDFTHRSLREGCRPRERDELLSLNALVVSHLQSLPASDPLRAQETVFHLHQGDGKAGLIAYIASLRDAQPQDAESLTLAARELRLICLADGGEWLDSLSVRAEELGLREAWVAFLVDRFAPEMEKTRREQGLLMAVLQSALARIPLRQELIGLCGRYRIAQAQEILGEGDRGRSLLEAVVDGLGDRAEEDREARELMLSSLYALSGLDLREGLQDRAAEHAERYARLAGEAFQAQPSPGAALHVIRGFVQRGAVWEAKGDSVMARLMYEEARERFEALGEGEDSPSLMEERCLFAERFSRMLLASASNSLASVMARQALDTRRKLFYESERFGRKRDYASALLQMGRIYEATGPLEEALDWHRKSLALFEELALAQDTPEAYRNVNRALCAVARMLMMLGRGQEAAEPVRRALAMMEEQAKASREPEVLQCFALSLRLRGTVFLLQGRRAEGMGDLEASFQVCREALSRSWMPELAAGLYDLLTDIARLHENRREYARGAEALEALLPHQRRLAEEAGAYVARYQLFVILDGLSQMHRGMGEDGKALSFLLEALGVIERVAYDYGATRAYQALQDCAKRALDLAGPREQKPMLLYGRALDVVRRRKGETGIPALTMSDIRTRCDMLLGMELLSACHKQPGLLTHEEYGELKEMLEDIDRVVNHPKRYREPQAEPDRVFKSDSEEIEAIAAGKLGMKYLAGDGIARDCAKAVKWFRKAAEYNIGDACHALGQCYENGWGVESSQAKAAELYERAACAYHVEARCKIAERYLTGNGVERCLPKALRWYLEAAADNSPEACRAVVQCFSPGGWSWMGPDEKLVRLYQEKMCQRDGSPDALSP